MRTVLKFLIPIGVLGIAGVVAVLLIGTKPETPATPIVERVWTVETMPVRIADVRPELQLYGEIVAGREVALRARVGGPVIEVGANFADGGIMAVGDLVLAVDPFAYDVTLTERRAEAREAQGRLTELNARLAAEQGLRAEAVNRLDIARRDLQRREQLVGQAVSEKSLDDARIAASDAQAQLIQRDQQVAMLSAQIEQQRAVIERIDAAVRQAERDRADTRLEAPFNGYVAETGAELGEWLRPGDQVGRLIDSDRLEARVYLSDQQFAQAVDRRADGAAARAAVIWRTGETTHVYDAVLDRTAGEIDATTGGIHAYAKILDNSQDDPLRPGAFVEIRLPNRQYAGVAELPDAALHGGDTVYVVEQGRLVPRAVDLVAYNGDAILVRGELADGEPVVLTRFSEIGPGVRVAVAE